MRKNEYLLELGTALRKSRVEDADEIVREYEQHFDFKLSDGYAEEEIAAKLEAPEQVAARYAEIREGKAPAGVAGIKIAMGLLAVFEALLYLIFFVWVVVIAAASLTLAVLGVCLIINVNIAGLIPEMPYITSLLFGLSILDLAVLFAILTRLCYAFFRQIIRASIRWHGIVTGATALPPISWTPQFDPAKNRKARNVMLWALVVFGVTLILGFVISSLSAGSIEFWHTWDWFVG